MARCYAVTFVRLLEVICLAAIAVLVAVASGYCVATTLGGQTTTYCEAKETPFSINHWSDGSTFAELKGQYFVFGSALVLFLLSLVLFFMSFAATTGRHFIIITCSLGAIDMLIAGVLEGWFAAGFGNAPQGTSFYIRSWVASAVFCFITTILYIIDVVLVAKS